MKKIANISHDVFKVYTGTSIPTNYKFMCWVGDENEKELLESTVSSGREVIQVEIDIPNTIRPDSDERGLLKDIFLIMSAVLLVLLWLGLTHLM